MNDIVKAFEFNLELRRQTAVEPCRLLFRQQIAPYGFDTFACGELDLRDRGRAVFFLIDWSDKWARFYAASGLVERDPVVEALATRLEPFTWSDLRADRTLPKIGLKALDLCAAEGWNEGLVVPLGQVGNRVGLVSMAGRDCNLTVEARAYLCMIAICLQTHVRVLVGSQGFAVPPMGLTEREIACLRLVAKGRSDAEIGENLGISKTTAHEFVEKAKRRLSVKSRAELVGVAVSLGIVDL
ncbi:autoinducer binding domain-containing protein [Novosphingobium sp.]|uniref:helix-turn-helix transcriptional regulator n=1 Tax=Novosphingobium sp. TaxID=1874826 RepID=UPI003B52A2E9